MAAKVRVRERREEERDRSVRERYEEQRGEG